MSGITGKSYLFWVKAFEKKENKFDPNELGYQELDSERVRPQDVMLQPCYDYATVFFMETRDLHRIVKQRKGVYGVIWFKEEGKPEKACLAYIIRLLTNKNYAELLVWNGKVDITNSNSEAIPKFYLLNRDSITDRNIEDHFIHMHLNISQHKLTFIKQVCGYQSYMKNHYQNFIPYVDCFDKCLDVGFQGPNFISLPGCIFINASKI
jgi:hypothetical protein